MRFVFVIFPGWGRKAVPALEAWEKRYPGSILAIEGPNEVNNWPVEFEGKTGVPAAQAFQASLYDDVKASPVIGHLPVLALTSYPVFKSKSDIGNIHAYSRSGEYITAELESSIKQEETGNPPAKRIWLTEIGYHTLIGNNSDEGVTPVIQARMLLSAYLDAFARGVDKTFMYQLLDQFTDPKDMQSHFGLIKLDWSEKPSFKALASMIKIVEGSTARADRPSPRPLAFSLENMPDTAQQLLLDTADGEWLLALWNEPKIWDRVRKAEIENETASVTLRLPSPAESLTVQDPMVGTAPTASQTRADALTITLDDHPVFIRIKMPNADACTPAAR